MLLISLLITCIVIALCKISPSVRDFISYHVPPWNCANSNPRAILLAAIFWPITIVTSVAVLIGYSWVGAEELIEWFCFTKEEKGVIRKEEEYKTGGCVCIDESGVAWGKWPAPPPPPSKRMIKEDFEL